MFLVVFPHVFIKKVEKLYLQSIMYHPDEILLTKNGYKCNE